MIYVNNLKELKSWNALFEIVMIKDTCASASILSYYLDDVEDNGSIFCPLGYELYKVIGHAMRIEQEAFEAAVETGLMRGGIATYVNAALDTWESWELMRNGVMHIMSDPRLKIFVSFYNQFYVDNLKNIEDEEEWNTVIESLVDLFNSAVPKGYCLTD